MKFMGYRVPRWSPSRRRSGRRNRVSGNYAQPLRLESLEDRRLLSGDTLNAFVITDKLDYAPGEVATITAGNFEIGETLAFHVDRTDGIPIEAPPAITDWQVTDGSVDDLDGLLDGFVTTTWDVDPQFLDASLQLTATGNTSGLTAQTEFTDALGDFITRQNGDWNDQATWAKDLTGTVSFNSATSALVGVGTLFTTELSVGDILMTTTGLIRGTVASITDDTHLTLTANALGTNPGNTYTKQAVPSSTDGTINIGNTVTVTANVTADQLTISASGGQVNVNSGVNWTIADGTGTDLTLNGVIIVNGTMTQNGSASMAGSGSITVNSGGSLPIAGSLAMTNRSVTVNAGGDLSVTSTGTITGTSGTWTINGTSSIAGSLTSLQNVIIGSTGNLSVTGNFAMGSVSDLSITGTLALSGTATASVTRGNAGNTLVANSGALVSMSGTSTLSIDGHGNNNMQMNTGSTLQIGPDAKIIGGGDFTLATGANLKIGSTAGITTSGAVGNIQNTGGTRSFSTGANYTYNGTAAQNTGTALPATVNNFTIDNAAGVTLNFAGATLQVNGTLALTNGDFITTASKTLVQPASAPASTGTGDVVGTVQRGTAASPLVNSVAYTFGNPNNIIELTGATLAAGANIAMVLAKNAPAGKTDAVERTYTITPTGVSGGFAADLQLHYLDSELNGNSESSLHLWKNISGTYVDQDPTTASTTRDTTNNWVNQTGITSFSDWTLASPGDVTAPTVTVDIVDASLSDTDNSSVVTFEFSEDVADFDATDLTVVGGTISGFSGSGSSYSATFTADDGVETTGSVAVGTAYTDLALNPGSGGSDTVDIDTQNPTVTVDIVDASLSDTDNSSVVTFEFSEDVADFDATDLTVVGGTISGFSGSGSSYSATFTADDGVETTGSVAVGTAYTDLALNPGSGGSDTVDIDTQNPTVTVDIVDASLSDTDNSSVVTFEFSEDVADFDATDLTVVGGTISGFSGSGSSYSATFTADDGVETTGSVAVGTAYTDLALNPGSGGSDTVDIDTQNPTVTVDIVDASLSDTDNSSVVTFEFSEDVADFDATDLTVVGGTISGFSGSGSSYSATFTADDGVETTGSVAVGTAYTDLALNPGSGGSDTVDIDTQNPTVTVDIVDASLSDTDNSSVVTFEFSEDVADFDATDLTVVGGTISGFSGSGSSYSATFTADDGVETTGSVAVGTAYTDLALNPGSGGSDTVDIDTQNPTVTVDIVDASLSDTDNSSVVTFEFSEDVADFDATDLTVVGGTISGFSGSGSSYSATFTADDGVETTGSVAVGTAYTDLALNPGSGGSDTVDIDTQNPTVTVDIVDASLSDTDNSSLVTFEFSEDVADFDATDLTVVGGTISGFSGSGSSYSATFTADDGVETTGSVAVGTAYTDLALNPGSGGSDTVDIDTQNPTVTVDIVDASLSDTDNSSVVTFEFSEDVADFDATDLTVVGGTISGFSGSGSSYSATFTADDGVETTGSVAVGTAYTDLALNPGSGGSDTVDIDTQNPTVTVDIVDASLSDTDNSSVVTFEFSEDVADFDATDLTVVGGTISGFSGSGSSYSATFTADDGVETTGSVAVGTAYTDLALNPGSGGSDTVDIDTQNPTVTVDIVDASLSDTDNSSVVTFEFSEDVADFDATDLTVVGGTISGFSGSGSSYSATFTADDGVETTGSVAVGTAYTDLALNPGSGGSDTVDIDTQNPTVTVDIVDASLSDTDNSSVVTFEFSEDVADFDATDLTVVGGTISGFSGSGSSYSATFTADDGVETTGSVAVGTAYTDLALNPGSGGSDTVDIDTQNPTVTVDIVDASLSDTDNSSVVTFEFSEDVADFDATDLTVVGGTISGFSGSGSSYSATFTADDGVETTGSVAVGTAYTDLALNPGSGGSDTVDIDTQNPTVTVDIVDASLSDTDNSSVVTFEFSEDVADFDATDLTVVGGTISGFSGSGSSYSATFTADDGVETTGSVAVGTAYTDLALNPGSGGSDTVDIDTQNPTVTVDIVDASLSDTDNSSVVTFEFSEDVADFDATDLTVVGGTISGFSGSGSSYSATFTADDGVETTGSVAVGTAYTDLALNPGSGGSDTVDIDTQNPTVTVDIVDASLSDTDNSSVVTFEFSEDVADFDATDLTVVGGTISGFSGSGSSYSATFTADDGVETTGSVAVGTAYTDLALNPGSGGSDTVDIDTQNPTVTVDIVDASLSDTDNSSVVTFEFSEDVADFDATDLTVVGGTISGFSGSGSSYSATFTADDGVETTGSVAVGTAYTDLALNPGSGGSDTVDIDTQNPTVTVDIVDASLSDTDNSSVVTFEFSEDVADFDATDLTVVGGTISGFSGSGSSYSATFTADDGVETTGSVAVGTAYTDLALNPGSGGSDTVDIDTQNPTVTVDIVDASLSDTDNSSVVTFEFSEDVADFDATDLTVVGGTISGFSGSGSSYSATFTADDGVETTGSVAVGTAYTDLALNPGSGGSDTVDIDTQEGLFGDYNGNNVIDAADYTVWRDALTAGSTSLPNDPTPGVVDESDFLYWRAHFGETLGTGNGSAQAAAPTERQSEMAEPLRPQTTSLLSPELQQSTEPTASQSLAAPATAATQRLTFPAGLVFQTVVSRSSSPRLARHELPAVVASRDQALVAWLAARSIGARHELPAADLVDLLRDPDRPDAPGQLENALDLAFESVGVQVEFPLKRANAAVGRVVRC